jgi:hypothetical protein
MAPRGRSWLRTRDEDPFAVFVRGATVGAFVGAVIAGSTIWRRARRPPTGAPTPGTGGSLQRGADGSPVSPGGAGAPRS